MVSQATRTVPAMGTMEVMDDIASGQWSLVARRQLVEAGVSASRIARLLRTGVLREVRPGVFAAAGSRRSWQQTLMAAVLAAGPGAVASHASAARLWDLAYLPLEAVDVTILVEPSDRRPRRRAHRTTILPDEDRAIRSGIPCTSFERTLCDCSTTLTPFQLGRVLDDGLRRGAASLERLKRCTARLDSGPGRRLSVVKQLLAERDEAFHPGGSASELRVVRVIVDAGLPRPVQQYHVAAGGRRYVVDFAWPEHRVFAEYYGLRVHSGASAVAYDSARLSALVAAGWRPLVFTESTPDREIVRDLADVLATAPSDGALTDRMSA